MYIDHPLEGYNSSRFDWTGKITKVEFRDIELTGMENPFGQQRQNHGRGFFNEFGIVAPLGFDEADRGEWFHKIGIGLLKKDAEAYSFQKQYEIRPANFEVKQERHKLLIICTSEEMNGYAYGLKKEIELLAGGFVSRYWLKNTGEKSINTTEYNHNFLAIANDSIGENYCLAFPFTLRPDQFEETVNPEEKVVVGAQEIQFSGSPQEQFFFSNLSGGAYVEPGWELLHSKKKIGIRERVDFPSNSINLWGWKHVISPEIFFPLSVEPDQSLEWSRTYEVFPFS